jgi:dTDP-4-amino-4,6-dideoxygalactose transaminase
VVAREQDRRGMIPIIKPVMDEREVEAARRVILSGWITQGPEVAAFEREFAEFVGAPHACAVSSCTTALHLALLAAGVKPGDEVITVSHSYIATANAVRYCGARPVFVDIEQDTFNIDPTLIDAAVTERTRAVLVVHQMGMPCDVAAVMVRAREYGLTVVEDAACAIGSEVLWESSWERIGKPQGDIACFSFHPRKVMSTGDGGMVTTANSQWDACCRLLRQHGMSVPDTVRHGARQVIHESYPVLGYNYRMTDIQAAVGREQLKRLPDIVRSRRALAERYSTMLSGVPGLETPREPEWARSNWQSYCVRLPAHCDQRAVMQRMLDQDVASRRGIMCSHREAAYAGDVHGRLPHSEEAQDRSIILPLYSQMTPEEQGRVVHALEEACASRTVR